MSWMSLIKFSCINIAILVLALSEFLIPNHISINWPSIAVVCSIMHYYFLFDFTEAEHILPMLFTSLITSCSFSTNYSRFRKSGIFLSVFFALFATDEIFFIPPVSFQDSLLGFSANNCFTSDGQLIVSLKDRKLKDQCAFLSLVLYFCLARTATNSYTITDTALKILRIHNIVHPIDISD